MNVKERLIECYGIVNNISLNTHLVAQAPSPVHVLRGIKTHEAVSKAVYGEISYK